MFHDELAAYVNPVIHDLCGSGAQISAAHHDTMWAGWMTTTTLRGSNWPHVHDTIGSIRRAAESLTEAQTQLSKVVDPFGMSIPTATYSPGLPQPGADMSLLEIVFLQLNWARNTLPISHTREICSVISNNQLQRLHNLDESQTPEVKSTGQLDQVCQLVKSTVQHLHNATQSLLHAQSLIQDYIVLQGGGGSLGSGHPFVVDTSGMKTAATSSETEKFFESVNSRINDTNSAFARASDLEAISLIEYGTGERSLGFLPEDGVIRGSNGLIESFNGVPIAEYLRRIGRYRADQYRLQRGKKFSRKEIGSAISLAIDRRTGEIREGTNGEDNDLIPYEKLHSLLKERLSELKRNGPYPNVNKDGSPRFDDHGKELTQEYPHYSKPLNHAEIKAINKILINREEKINRHTIWDELIVDTYFPFQVGGVKAAPCCVNCHNLLLGVSSNAGRFTSYPPSPDNFLME